MARQDLGRGSSMLGRVTIIELQRPADRGKSQPLFVVGQLADGIPVEAVAKFSAFCERDVTSLTMEVLAACLAGDLELPVPEPLLLDVPKDWIDVVPDKERQAKIRDSSPVAFGSRVITGQFSLWSPGTKLHRSMVPTAASILVFDGIIQNPDRRSENPNCLVRGEDIRIFDHELAFLTNSSIIGWRPPWAEGGLKHFETPGFHIFRDGLRHQEIDFGPIRDAWMGLSDARLDEYLSWLPGEWDAARANAEQAISLIKEARGEIDGCIAEVKRVLT